MKVVILAGGFGTRISEESAFKPKPMIEIGGMPILWHIMKTYSAYGYNEFVICAGYKQHVIKEWFADYFLHTSDITFDYTHGTNEMIVHNKHAEPWRVTVVDTGLNTQTGGRVKRIREYIGNEPFMLTYGDAVGDVNIAELVAFHQAHGKIGTMSMYNFGQNKGVVEVGANSVIDAFRGLNAHILVQEYIKEAQGCDIRCLVVGDEVVAAIERRAKEGDFRSNLHRGGAASVASITPQEREIAIKAARTMALDVAGVDILRANRGPLVMEVNASPGLEGIEKTTGIDIAGKMIRWIERHATTEYCLKTGG